MKALLCEVTINSLCKCFVLFFYPHLHIKSKTCAYIRHLLQNLEWNLVDGKALDYRFYTQMRVECICFRMQSEIQQMVELQTIDFIRKADTKKTKHLPIECLQGTIIIYSVQMNLRPVEHFFPHWSHSKPVKK